MITPRIHQLSPIIANQIAAGEVIERPASVVKELLENSLDAGSTHIEIVIEKGGTSLIQITDNGCGIEKDDLALALSRHATSKISTVDDLNGIISLGFRGEALASIASVSQLRLVSSTGNNAWQITIESEELLPLVTAAAHPRGTTIEVVNLFFNTPVRRKFLRSERTELRHIEDVVKRAALSYFSVGFKFTSDSCEIFNLPPALTYAEREKRVAKICGKKFLTNSLAIDQQAEGLQLSGWINLPEHSRAYSDLQYFFLNGRMVRDKVLGHALRSAMQDLLPSGRYAAYILYLQCDPKTVDVNVHPTKHEVRFEQARLIHDFISSAIERTFKNITCSSNDVSNIEPEYYVRELVAEYKPIVVEAKRTLGKPIAQIKQHYILAEREQGLSIIDLRIAKRALFQYQLQKTLIKQPLLMPVTIKISEEKIKKLISLSLEKFGIELQQISQDQLVLRALPNILKAVSAEILLQQLSVTDNIIDCISKLAAEIPKVLARDEMQGLLEQLESLVDLPVKCMQLVDLS